MKTYTEKKVIELLDKQKLQCFLAMGKYSNYKQVDIDNIPYPIGFKPEVTKPKTKQVMKQVIIVCAALIMSMSMNAQNSDGSTVSINSASLTSLEGTIDSDTKFSLYIPGETFGSAVHQILDQVNAKENTDIWVRGIKYTVIYSKGVYLFGNMEFENKSELVKYLNPWLKEKLLNPKI